MKFDERFLGTLRIYKHRIFNIGYYFLGSVLGMLITMAINPFIALNMTHKDYALIGYYGSYTSLLTPVISLMFATYYSRYFFRLNEAEQIKLRNTLIISLVIFSSAVSLITLMGLYIFFKVTEVSFPFTPFALLSVISIYFGTFYSFRLVDLKLKSDAKGYFRLSLSRSVVAAILAIFFVVVIKGGAFGKMFATALSAFIFAVFDFRCMLTKWEFDKVIFKEALKFSWPLAAAAMLNYFFSGVDRAFLEPLNNVNQLGLYNVAVQITGYLAIFNTTIGSTFQPDILQSIIKKQKTRTIKLLGGITLMNVLPILVFIILAPFLLKILTYNRYTDASDFARILSLRNVSNSIYFSLSTIIIGYGFTKITLWSKILGSIFSFFLIKSLINNYGFDGAAWGQVISYLILSVLSIMFITYKLKVKNVFC